MFSQYFSPGTFGVDLFFVVSGFLITTILLKPNKKSFGLNYKNFIGRRILRVFPIYYLTIVILWLAGLDVARNYLLLFLTYTFNYGWVKYNLPFTPVTHFWTLCVEEQFYLFWPVIVLLLKDRIKTLTVILILFIVIGYAQMVFNIIPSLSDYNHVGLLTQIAPFSVGAIASVLSIRNLLPMRIMNNIVIEVAMLVGMFIAIRTPYNYAPREVIFGIGSFYIVLKSAFFGFKISGINKFLDNGTVMKIGMLSYGMYVYHLPVEYYFNKYLFMPVWNRIDFNMIGVFKHIKYRPWLFQIPINTLLTIGVAWLSFNFVEVPILKLKNRYFA